MNTRYLRTIIRTELARFPERRTVRKKLELSGRNLRDSRYEHSFDVIMLCATDAEHI